MRSLKTKHLTRRAQVCFTGTDEVLGDQDMEERGDALEEADREADLLEQMPLVGHPESEKRTSSILASSSAPCSRCDHTITSKLATSTERSTRADVTCCPSSTRPYECRQDFDALDATTQDGDLKHTKCHHLDPIRSITKWESMCSRSLTQSACASRS